MFASLSLDVYDDITHGNVIEVFRFFGTERKNRIFLCVKFQNCQIERGKDLLRNRKSFVILNI